MRLDCLMGRGSLGVLHFRGRRARKCKTCAPCYVLAVGTHMPLEKVIIISKVVALGLRLGAQECLQVCNSKGGVQSSPVSATHGSH